MSQRNHAAQGGAGGGTHDTREEKELWDKTQKSLQKVAEIEARLMEIRQELSCILSKMELQEKSGTSTISYSIPKARLKGDRAIN